MKGHERNAKKADNFINEGYPQEVRVEPRDNAGVLSISPTSERRRNDDTEYEEDLLEKILDRDNMNLAYQKGKGKQREPWS